MPLQHFTHTDFQKWERFYRASFFNSLGGFKSCNLIGTKSKSGQENLGLFFSVIHVGANPPYIGLLFRPHTVPRHTLENIRETKSFTVNAVAASWHPKAHQAAANYEQHENEFSEVGLTAQYHPSVYAPFVKESLIQFACQPVEEQLIKANKTLFMVASVGDVYLEENMLRSDGLIDHTSADTVAVNSLDTYYQTQELGQLEYPRPHQKLKSKK
jgi:flavin reductase (DIM6/NTAB) family NADH-FMN oxidoreductase RutF